MSKRLQTNWSVIHAAHGISLALEVTLDVGANVEHTQILTLNLLYPGHLIQ